jgi:hypothetical protein
LHRETWKNYFEVQVNVVGIVADETEGMESRVKELESQIDTLKQEVTSRDNTIAEQQKNVRI